jgi:hypothetical protein
MSRFVVYGIRARPGDGLPRYYVGHTAMLGLTAEEAADRRTKLHMKKGENSAKWLKHCVDPVTRVLDQCSTKKGALEAELYHTLKCMVEDSRLVTRGKS